MSSYPIFMPHLTVEILPGEGVLLLSEDASRALHGRLYEQLAPLLDGENSADRIVDALAPEFPATHVYYALALLEKNGYITQAVRRAPPAAAAFWSGLGIMPDEAADRIGQKSVAIRTVGDADAGPLRTSLQRSGVRVIEGAPADLLVILTDDYQRSALARINEEMLASGQGWLLARLGGYQSWLGPLYLPGKTACHGCLSGRLKHNRPVHRFIAERHGAEPPIAAKAALPSTHAMAAELLTTEIIKLLAGMASELHGKVLSVDSRRWECQYHSLQYDPYCPACGEPPVAESRPVQLGSRRAPFDEDGGYRSVAPEHTYQRYQHLVSPITGIVTTLAPVSRSDSPTHVYVAGHNGAFRMRDLNYLKHSLRNASAGKGMSEAQARTSALCEAIERFSGERRGGEVVVTASHEEMLSRFGEDVIHPNEVMRYSERQLAERDAWNAQGSRFNVVPEALDLTERIDWTPVWSLTRNRHRYLPTQLLYHGSEASANSQAIYAIGCSNGCASGNNLEEAVLQGFFELVERDAVALWWYNRLRKPAVDLQSFSIAGLQEALAFHAAAGREAWALDLTSDLGIPVFVALSRRRDASEQRILLGLGCHLEPRIALQRAFAELNQMYFVDEAQRESGAGVAMDADIQRWFAVATLETQPYLVPDPVQPATRIVDFPHRHGHDLLEGIDYCRGLVEARGMEMLVLDQTHADIGMPVAKVIVPGLRHFWARFGSGRLYDVPVEMGWLSRAHTEDELNPIPVFV